MNPLSAHAWDVSTAEAVIIQNDLAHKVRTEPLPSPVRVIAGMDVSYNRFSDLLFASVVVLSFPELEVLEIQNASRQTHFPYQSGFLSFREAPVLLEAFGQLRQKVDLALLDGQGIAHPRGLGIASHVGVLLDLPTIGVGKSKLFGQYTDPGPEAGDWSDLTYKGKILGAVLRTKRNVSCVYVSIGHRAVLASAIELVMRCVRKHRIPEPTRLAHEAVNQFRREHSAGNSQEDAS